MAASPADAFISQFEIAGKSGGPLHGLSLAVKDIYDVQGHVTGCGNPDYARSQSAAPKNAPAVQSLLDAGARIIGKTITDELAYSLMGVNAHYGTPKNAAAPDRVPGGSSSGSVAAVAAGVADVGLGSDTGGSVRLPASFCGVFGLRTTHGKIPLDGVMPLAPSFDTAGWFARDSETLAKVGLAYGIDADAAPLPTRLIIATDALGLISGDTKTLLSVLLSRLAIHMKGSTHAILAAAGFRRFRETFRICQGFEAWQAHGDWITKTNPTFGPGVKERFETASKITGDENAAATEARNEITSRIVDMLGDDGIIALPTGPGPAPLRDTPEEDLNGYRLKALELLSAAGLAGLPQINIPVEMEDGPPIGLGLIGAPGADASLLAFARSLDQGSA